MRGYLRTLPSIIILVAIAAGFAISFGGLFTSFLIELLLYPAIYYRWKWAFEVRHLAAAEYRP
ncbi:MAG: hypothetical protein ABI718_16430 [Acidobacteriota bacterium]